MVGMDFFDLNHLLQCNLLVHSRHQLAKIEELLRIQKFELFLKNLVVGLRNQNQALLFVLLVGSHEVFDFFGQVLVGDFVHVLELLLELLRVESEFFLRNLL